MKTPVVSTSASALAGGAWALVPVGRARGLVRVLLVGLPAVVVVAAMTGGQRARVAAKGEGSLRAAIALPAVAGGAVAFTHWAALGLDRRFETFLVRRGVRRPRLVMAAAWAVITPLLLALDRSADEDEAGRTPRTSS